MLDPFTALPLLATALVTGSIRPRASGPAGDLLLAACVTSAILGVAGMMG